MKRKGIAFIEAGSQFSQYDALEGIRRAGPKQIILLFIRRQHGDERGCGSRRDHQHIVGRGNFFCHRHSHKEASRSGCIRDRRRQLPLNRLETSTTTVLPGPRIGVQTAAS
jgi:hypothetical protein